MASRVMTTALGDPVEPDVGKTREPGGQSARRSRGGGVPVTFVADGHRRCGESESQKSLERGAAVVGSSGRIELDQRR